MTFASWTIPTPASLCCVFLLLLFHLTSCIAFSSEVTSCSRWSSRRSCSDTTTTSNLCLLPPHHTSRSCQDETSSSLISSSSSHRPPHHLLPSQIILASAIFLWQPLLLLTPSPANAISTTNLSDTPAFQMLPREQMPLNPLRPASINNPSPILLGAIQELKELQELQDERLESCAERGVYWEQCFMFGESDDGIKSNSSSISSGGASGGIRGGPDRGRMDNQLISPVGAMNMPSDQKKIPTW